VGTSSWSYIWDTNVLEDGAFEISARAFDGLLYSDIQSVTVPVDNPYSPTLILFTDIPDKISGKFELKGTSSDKDGDIKKVEIQIDSGDWILITTSKVWSYELDTKDLSNGLHSIVIRATDDEGEKDEISFSIFVENEEDEDSLDMIMLLVLIVVVIVLVTARMMLHSRSKGIALYNDQEIQGPVFQTLQCPVCENIFQADTSITVQCPRCGYSSNT
jgi:hypothetical protein